MDIRGNSVDDPQEVFPATGDEFAIYVRGETGGATSIVGTSGTAASTLADNNTVIPPARQFRFAITINVSLTPGPIATPP